VYCKPTWVSYTKVIQLTGPTFPALGPVMADSA
jgi:hypothetical protein